MRRALAAAFFAVVTACGLVSGIDGYDLAIDPSTTSDDATVVGDGGGTTTVIDSSAITDQNAGDTQPILDACAPPSTSGGDVGCTPVLVPGFTAVVAIANGTTCPSGHDLNELIETPTSNDVKDGCACGTCSATINCSSGTLSTKYDLGTMLCTSNGLNFNAGGCDNLAGSTPPNSKVDPPAAVISGCTALGVAAKDKVTTTKRSVCKLRPSACVEDVCPSLTATQRACFLAQGNIACPSQASEKTVVGSDFSVTCAACGCAMTATCQGFAMTYSQPDCPDAGFLNIADGTCGSNTNVGAGVKSIKWTGSVKSQVCTPNAPPQPTTVSLTNVQTLCCPPP